MMNFENLRIEKNEHIAIVTFNRPKAHNVLNLATIYELEKLVGELSKDDSIRVVVFTGSGKSFIAGADIADMEPMTESEAKKYSLFGSEVFNRVTKLEKISIAAINGYCFGGGNEFAMHCDLRYASTLAKFSQPEVCLGVIPGFSGTQTMPRIIGMAKTKELVYTGRTFSAEEACEIGLINQVFEEEHFMEDVMNVAHKIVSNSFVAVINAKKAIHEGFEKPFAEGIFIEATHFSKCFTKPDQKEGMRAFLEKRPPNYQK